MTAVNYDVELIRQEQNPICWVASCAMVKGFGLKASVGVGDLTEGFDPSNSCIGNLAGDWAGCVAIMEGWNFATAAVSDLSSGTMTGEDLATALQDRGPAVLLHLCSGFPYGPGWVLPTEGAHAVVLTGIDTDASTILFNNPWGDKDRSADLDTVLAHINADQRQGKTFGFWPSA